MRTRALEGPAVPRRRVPPHRPRPPELPPKSRLALLMPRRGFGSASAAWPVAQARPFWAHTGYSTHLQADLLFGPDLSPTVPL